HGLVDDLRVLEQVRAQDLAHPLLLLSGGWRVLGRTRRGQSQQHNCRNAGKADGLLHHADSCEVKGLAKAFARRAPEPIFRRRDGPVAPSGPRRKRHGPLIASLVTTGTGTSSCSSCPGTESHSRGKLSSRRVGGCPAHSRTKEPRWIYTA